jgi:tetratricopeptide (TPR) repeat protein
MTDAKRGYLLIALAALASHLTSLRAGFIWLDHAHLEDGLALAQDGDFLALFTRGFAGTGYYRPLMSVSLSLDAALGGGPFVYHSFTLLWHAGAAVLACGAAVSLGLSLRVAFGAGLLFAVHPLTSLVANAVAFRSESMVAVALLGMIALHQRGKVWPSALMLLAGALTKETALVLGPLFILALELFRPQPRVTPARLRWKLIGAEAAALGAALALRFCFAPPFRAQHPALSASEAVGSRLASLAKSVRAALLPIDNGVCDAFQVARLTAPSALLGAALLLGAGYLAYRRKGPALLLLLALMPSLQLVPVMRWWSPHYLYLPLAFAAMLAVEALERWAEGALRWVAPAALALGGLTLLEGARYHDDERFWVREVELEPACREAHYFLGDVARAAGRLQDAVEHYEQALADRPGLLSYVDRAAAMQNLGVTQLQQRQFDDASRTFREALALNLDEKTRGRLQHNLVAAEMLSRKGTRLPAPPK